MSTDERKIVVMPGSKRFLVRFQNDITNPGELEKIEDSYIFAKESHRGQYRGDGVTHYFHHLSDTADIISVELGLKFDWRLIVLAWLHDIVENCQVTLDEIEARWGSTVRLWLDLLSKGEEYKKDKESYIRRMRECGIIEVIICKLSDRLANLRTLGMVPNEEFQIKQINETIRDYLPLADLLISMIADSDKWRPRIYVGIHLKSAIETQITSFRAEYGDHIAT